jgi:diaminohydroxyphosphoribosylaminopyrimidine deaminase / 5-amino-6-(5-phosphoribosylamino)uracil reductase
VVLDTHLAIQPHAALLAEKGPVVVFTGHQAPAEKEHILQSLWSDTLTIERVAVKNEHLDLAQVLQRLAEIYHCNTVLIEAGARLSGAFLQAGLIDELIIYQAPILLGSDARSLVDIPLATMSEKIVLEISDQRFVGDDIRIIATLKKTDHDRVTEESLRKL